MRVIIQRVSEARVEVGGMEKGKIGPGLLIFIGVAPADGGEDVVYLTQKIAHLRIFDDENHQMNRSILDTNGDILAISQFTLYAQTKKGNRPGFTGAAGPVYAKALYGDFVRSLEKHLGKTVQTGLFGAEMTVHLVNQGPVTLWLDSRNKE